MSGDRSRPDHYSRRAKQEGYQARSVYKLQEIQQRFRLIRAGNRVLDLGAAPGSWSRFLLRAVGTGGSVVAGDLGVIELPPDPRLELLQLDILGEDFPAEVERRGPFDAVVSDAAPATTGGRVLDTARSAALVEAIVAALPRCLRPGGNLAVKIFQGGEEQELLRSLRQTFDSARAFKPKACRSESFETYLVGVGFRGESEREQRDILPV
ncbi:MAG: RlmE family RNA methyltransferase [Spirochaetaceae bacterium]|nr:MAG: RlmE family RNA methyltransferase [Spirochaetaceae bacterium]